MAAQRVARTQFCSGLSSFLLTFSIFLSRLDSDRVALLNRVASSTAAIVLPIHSAIWLRGTN
jgi:hypothetical protein